MWTVERIELKDFRSFVGRHEFLLPSSGGLYYLTGDNLIEPDLGANGCGKSTLWDALFWCLYGVTSRGLKASALLPWAGDGKGPVDVRVHLRMVDGRRFALRRTWKPNALNVSRDGGPEEPLEQHHVDSLIGLDADTFQHTVLLSQFGRTFFDLSATEKLTLFTRLLGLDGWLSRAERAQQQYRVLSDAHAELQRSLSRLEGELAADERTEQTIQAQHQDFATRQRELVASLKRDRKAALNEKRSAEAELVKVAPNRSEVSGAQKAKEDLEALLNRSNTLREQAATLRGKRDGIKAQQERIAADVKRLGSVKGKCPVCLQNVSPAHLETERKRLLKDGGGLDAEDARLRVELQAIADDLQTIAVRRGDAERVCADFADRLRDLDELKDRLTEIVRETTAGVRDLDARIAVEERRGNPHAHHLRETRARMVETRTALNRKKGTLVDIEQRREATRYWVNGFKAIRLFLVEEALTELAISVNNNLLRLGLRGWTVRFDVERETKSGTISRGFQTFVKSPRSPDEVPWESWSGGELQRLRLAGAMGVADLILSRKGVAPSLELWDEPSDGLSPEGVDSVVLALADRADETGRQVWLTEHQAIDFGGFAQTFVVEMTEDGSQVRA